MAKMKLEEFGGASSDASKAIEIDPKAVKAYYRRSVEKNADMNEHTGGRS